MEINQANLDALFLGYKATFNKSIREVSPWFPMISQDEASSTSEELYFFREERARMKPFLGERTIKAPGFLGFRLANETFEDTVEVPLDAIADDQYGKYNGMVTEMAEAAGLLPDDLGLTLIETGETSLCYDGQNFFDTDHPVSFFDASQGVQSNLFTAKPLTADNFQEVYAAMCNFKDATGRRMRIRPNKLMVPPRLKKTAMEIVTAALVSNGGTNVLAQFDVEPWVNPDLTVDDAWYLLCTTKSIKPFIRQKRQAPRIVSLDQLNSENVFKNRRVLFGSDAREKAGYGRWQLAVKARP